VITLKTIQGIKRNRSITESHCVGRRGPKARKSSTKPAPPPGLGWLKRRWSGFSQQCSSRSKVGCDSGALKAKTALERVHHPLHGGMIAVLHLHPIFRSSGAVGAIGSRSRAHRRSAIRLSLLTARTTKLTAIGLVWRKKAIFFT
jgi:hypothetical protein